MAFGNTENNSSKNQELPNYSTTEKNYNTSAVTNVSDKFFILTHLNPTPDPGEEIELASAKLQAYHILLSIQQLNQATDSEMNLFRNYYYDKLFGTDVNEFWGKVKNKIIVSDADIKAYADQKIIEYSALFIKFRDIEKNYPSTIQEYSTHSSRSPMGTCNPACDNIGFENGSLNAWSAYYAQNTSNNSFTSTTPTGGACGAVTRSALDPNTNSYQVALMSGAGNDPVAGSLIPLVCPTGGSYSCRIGDSTRNGAQIGILQQTFTVTQANANFTYMYAVVLENPGHSYYQQPYFNVQMTDQNGNPIPNCGNYSVVSAPGLPGYKAIYYPTDGDTVYCKPWTTVFVPLQAYIGQCITITVTTGDCALGGHFGYAYFDATCISGIITSFPVLCSNISNLTATAPAGASSYQWIGPCIVGPSNQQNVTVSCPGVYKVAITSIIGSGCADTIVDTVKGSAIPSVSVSQPGTNISCYGGSNGTATASATGGAGSFTYLWSPGGQTNAIATNLTAGSYSVIVTDANGCKNTSSVTITQPTQLNASATNTPVKCNGTNTGSATVTASGGTPNYAYSWAPGGQTGANATNLAAGTYTITVKDANGCTSSIQTTVTQPSALTDNYSSISVGCNGGSNGSATDSVFGGTPPYTYTWLPSGGNNQSANNLVAGSYTVQATDANGCIIKNTITVTQPSAITTSGSSSGASCNGGTNGSASVIVAGGTPSYTYSWAPNGGSNSNANNLGAGTYTVTITDAHNCKATSTIAVTQPSLLTASNTSTNVSCNGGSNGSAKVITTGGVKPYSYAWLPSISKVDSATNLPAGTYAVTVTDAHNCSTLQTITVNQPTQVVALQGSGNNVSCYGGNNGSTSVGATGGTPPYTYQWLPLGGNGYIANNLSAGAYTVTVTDAHNCPATLVTTISQPTQLINSLASEKNVSCYGGSNGSIGINAIGGITPYIYSWTPKVSTGASAANLTAGIYSVNTTDANGCKTTLVDTIKQPTQVKGNINSTNNISCYGGSNGSITMSATGGTPGYTYNWSPNTGTGASASNLTAGTYTITVTDANGCTTTVNTKLTQPNPISSNLSDKAPTCNGLMNGSASVTVNGGTPGYTYIWNTNPAQLTPTINNIGAGVYSVLITDAHGCTERDTVKVTQPFALIASIVNTTNPKCYGDTNGSTSVYVSGGTLPYTYNWNTSPQQHNYFVNNLSAGTYTVNITDAHNCPTAATVTLTQPTPIVTQATGPDSICSGTTVTLMASAYGGTGIYNYQWSNSGVTIATQNVTPTSTTTYTVTATDNNGCKGSPAVVTVNTWNLGPANVKVSPSQTVCYGDSITLYANITNSNSGAVNIQWSNGFNGTGPFKVFAPGDTTYTVTVINQCGSKVTDNVPVKVNPLPVIHIPVQSSAACYGTSFTYYDSIPANNGDSYLWSFGDSTTGTTNPITHTYKTSGTYTVTVLVTSTAGCNATASAPASVQIYPTAKAVFTTDPLETPISNPVIGCMNKSLNASTWMWDFGDKLSSSISYEENPTHTYSDTGKYTIHLYTNNKYGCADTAKQEIRIDPEFTFYIPNAFSPNGDGTNDVFTGKGIGIIAFRMMIFDRWGMLLYQTDDINKGWNGTVNGGSNIEQEDTYVYKVWVTDYLGKVHPYLGSVTIVK